MNKENDEKKNLERSIKGKQTRTHAQFCFIISHFVYDYLHLRRPTSPGKTVRGLVASLRTPGRFLKDTNSTETYIGVSAALNHTLNLSFKETANEEHIIACTHLDHMENVLAIPNNGFANVNLSHDSTSTSDCEDCDLFSSSPITVPYLCFFSGCLLFLERYEYSKYVTYIYFYYQSNHL